MVSRHGIVEEREGVTWIVIKAKLCLFFFFKTGAAITLSLRKGRGI